MKGKIKYFNTDKGFGFIETNDGDCFFHINTAKKARLIEGDLTVGNELDVEIGMGKKGKFEVKKFITQNKPSQERRTSRASSPHQSYKSNKNLLNTTNIHKNFYLFLNKPYHVTEHEKMYCKKSDGNFGFSLSTRFSKENKFKELEGFDFSGVDCTAIVERHKENITEIYPNYQSFQLKPDWRLTIGLGGASVYETDITLHHVYGVPYIPASSIKGIVRGYIIQEVFGDDEAAAILNKEFCDIFGCSKEHEIHKKGQKKGEKAPSYYGKNTPDKGDRKGGICFFDAFPTNSRDIQVSMDIMNVHYKPYYDATKNDKGFYVEKDMPPPADWSSPTIINFLTVKNATFQFLIAAQEKDMLTVEISDKSIFEWTKEALEEHGIGAKTAVGYGYFS